MKLARTIVLAWLAAGLTATAVAQEKPAQEKSSRRDLASLMPPKVLAYAELVDPGGQIATLAATAGIDLEWLLAATGPLGKGEGPAQIFAEIKKAHGAAAAITAMDAQDEPEGLLIVDPGDSLALMAQFRTLANTQGMPGEPIEGMNHVKADKLTILVGESIIIAGRPERLVREAAAKYAGNKAPSLLGDPLFKKLSQRRKGSAIFGYANLPAGIAALKRKAGQTKDIRGLDALLDLDSLEHLYVRLAIDKDKVLAEAGLQLADAHNNILYDLIRTPPVSAECLRRIPSSAWAVLAGGLGDPAFHVASIAKAAAVRHLTGLDLGRELFANIREVAICAMPVGDDIVRTAKAINKPPMSLAIGAIIGTHDAQRSKALLAKLADFAASLIQIDHPAMPQVQDTIKVAGVETSRYQFGDPGPSLCLAVKDGFVYLAMAPSILERMLAPADPGAQRTDASLGGMLASAEQRPSKLVLLDLGSLADSPETQKAMNVDPAGKVLIGLLSKAVASIATEETPTSLSVRIRLAGLGNVGAQLPALIAKQKAAQQPPADEATP